MSKDRPRIAYIDSVDWDYELGEALGGTVLYESPEDCKEERPCMRDGGCGIYKVEVRFVEEIQREDLKFDDAGPGFQVSAHMRGKVSS